MKYTKDQKKRMIAKLEAMKSGTIFNLNKNDVCPIKCKLVKDRNFLSILATEINDEVLFSAQGTHDRVMEAAVDCIEDYINHWDLMTKQFFINKARLQGYEP